MAAVKPVVDDLSLSIEGEVVVLENGKSIGTLPNDLVLAVLVRAISDGQKLLVAKMKPRPRKSRRKTR